MHALTWVSERALPSHGRRGTMLGSETQKVAAAAHVPVIVDRVETAS